MGASDRMCLLGALALGLLFVVALSARGEEKPAPEPVLPGMPEGVNLGMNIEDVLLLRPKAVLFDLDGKTKADVNLKKGHHGFLEEIANGLRYSKVVGYEFAEGRCVGFGWEAEYAIGEEAVALSPEQKHRPDFAGERVKLIQNLRALLGAKYEKHLIRKELRDASCLMPVFLWKTDKRVVALATTSDYQGGVTLKRGILQLNVWKLGSEGLEDSFEKDVPAELLSTLFAPLEKEPEPKKE